MMIGNVSGLRCLIILYLPIVIILITDSYDHNYYVSWNSILEAPYLESTEDKENNQLQITGAYLTIIVDFDMLSIAIFMYFNIRRHAE